jgi:hypothetical protein
MASAESSSANGTSATNGALSAAQKLQQKHDEEAHKAFIEEVPDEDDLKHGESPENLSGILEGPGDAPAPGWVAPISAKAAGKRKEDVQKENKPLFDTQSEEAFPGLGGSKPTPAVASTPLWKVGAKPANSTNGVSTNGTSTPTSGMSTPQPATAKPVDGLQMKGLPGQFRDAYHLKANEMLPRTSLKKPLPELLKDINKRSKAKVTYTQTPHGIMFNASGPEKAVSESLRDVVANVGAKVRN